MERLEMNILIRHEIYGYGVASNFEKCGDFEYFYVDFKEANARAYYRFPWDEISLDDVPDQVKEKWQKVSSSPA
jgi:hypothetical protein